MRIKILVNGATRFGQRQQGEVDVPEAEAAELLERGWAISLVDVPEAEAAELLERGWAISLEEAAAAPVSTETPGPLAELESAALSGPEETAAAPAPRRKRKGA